MCLPATARHSYQQAGVRWLYLLHKLGLGACLADDMGLGKTIQVLALLLVLKNESANASRPSLLVAPASLLANWAAEIERFAPQMRALIAHPSAMPADELKAFDTERLSELDLVITSYGTLLRLPWIANTRWRAAVLDEAQAIKNPGAKQTRAANVLDAGSRIALTGTPVENRLSDLWSIFDFLNPGLLGSGKAFSRFTRRLDESGHYGPLRELVRPYLLRRLKTDKTVIADLPDKTEVKAWCNLSARQAALYEHAVEELAAGLGAARGIARKGAVLAFLMRFKQILNHPSQWLGDGAWNEDDSGKFRRLREGRRLEAHPLSVDGQAPPHRHRDRRDQGRARRSQVHPRHSESHEHRGVITVTSQPGQGTTFDILLPMAGASKQKLSA